MTLQPQQIDALQTIYRQLTSARIAGARLDLRLPVLRRWTIVLSGASVLLALCLTFFGQILPALELLAGAMLVVTLPIFLISLLDLFRPTESFLGRLSSRSASEATLIRQLSTADAKLLRYAQKRVERFAKTTDLRTAAITGLVSSFGPLPGLAAALLVLYTATRTTTPPVPGSAAFWQAVLAAVLVGLYVGGIQVKYVLANLEAYAFYLEQAADSAEQAPPITPAPTS